MGCRFRKLLQIQMLRSASVSQVRSLCMPRAGISVVHAIVPQMLDHHVLHETLHAVLAQFDNEISKDLKPRLARTGDEDLLQPFLDYFEGKSFKVGTSLLALWEGRFPHTMMGIEGITVPTALFSVWAML